MTKPNVESLRSLAYRTDLMFPAFDGEIHERDHYFVIKTPSNPTFYWGNFLLFKELPAHGCFRDWLAAFATEIGTPPGVKHQVFGWDTTALDPGAVAPFREAGFRISKCRTLTTQAPVLPRSASQAVVVRPLEHEGDWRQAVENQVRCRHPEFEEGGFRVFREREQRRYRFMVDAGRGLWFGAFVGPELVADLGVFHDGEIGRYQSVQTDPRYRRQGIAGRLVFEAGRYSMERFGLQTLVIVADDDSSAERIYQSTGFRRTEMQWGAERWEGMGGEPPETGDEKHL